MNEVIKFGTDGWRAIIAKEYTVDNLARVATATALWLKSKSAVPTAVVGHDCRFAGEMFAEVTTAIFVQHGIKVFLAKGFVSTPMVSMGTARHKADAGIIITASHNPPSYNGFKIKANYGGPALPAMIDEVEKLIPPVATVPDFDIAALIAQGKVEITDLESMYCQAAEEAFDLEAIRKSGLQLAYDAMFGSGQNVLRRLLPDITFLHCEHNPGFDGQAPEPIDKNLQELAELIKVSEDIDSGLATDGDADRIGFYNGEGRFIDSHHLILLLIQYLHTQKGLGGKVVNSFSCTSRISAMCSHYGLGQTITKIGFKYICQHMVEEDVLVGGEESGGIAVKGHIPERDGIWMGLMLWEFMAKSGKSIDELIEDVYAITGPFAVERVDLHLPEAQKQAIIARCKSGEYNRFGNMQVEKVEDMDGFKFHLGNREWVMIRASGTEPVLRTYAEAENSKRAFEILNVVKAAILG